MKRRENVQAVHERGADPWTKTALTSKTSRKPATRPNTSSPELSDLSEVEQDEAEQFALKVVKAAASLKVIRIDRGKFLEPS